MGENYLIDSNSVIDFFNGKLPVPGRQLLSQIEPIISIITYIELFSSNNIPEEEYRLLKGFVDIATLYSVTCQYPQRPSKLGKSIKLSFRML